MKEPQSVETAIALLQADMNAVKETLRAIELKLDNKYVTKEAHELVVSDVALIKKIVFGMVSFVLIAVLSTIVYNVVQ